MNWLKNIIVAAALICAGEAQAACWQWSKVASSNATADPSIGWSEGMSPSSVNDSARAMMARLAECRDDLSGVLLTTGTATVYALTTNQGLNAVPVDGQQIVARFHVANGAASTLAADGGTAYAIQSKVGTAVAASTLQTDGVYRLTFKLSAAAWLLQDFYNAPLGTNSITYDKIQQVAASRLLGNATGSLANVAEIPLGAGLSFSGGSLTASISATDLLGHIAGLTLSTAGASATFGIGTGVATDTAGVGTMVLSSAYTKTTSAWAVGTAAGGLDTGVIANSTWYHAFIIKRPDTAVVDICVGLDPTTGCAGGVGNIPAAYTLRRRIGAMKTTAGGQWTKFAQSGDTFIWDVSVADSGVVGAARQNLTLTVPTGVVVTALGRPNIPGAGGVNFVVFSSLLESDQAISASYFDIAQETGGSFASTNVARLTDTSARIGVRGGGAGIAFTFGTYGWIDSRGKN